MSIMSDFEMRDMGVFRRALSLGAGFYLCFLLSFCFASNGRGDCLRNQETAIRKRLGEVFFVGQTHEQMISIMPTLEILFSFDKFQNRYQATIRDGCGLHSAFSVYLNLDLNGSLSNIEVTKTFTGI
ncbi:hypothetical protein [Paucibacter sp. XJ19-41]|uniref:hypothetical protein n=1 Tax=Paucibacter sp. XJ19-41 TaxID=2927824 RepID=UPI00234B4CDB|nr:hypothetical protein [Paucibacter sp. XJ19-41]MDC6170013.1 hypothetical protein [Paucibacter sp. XJ19-41]